MKIAREFGITHRAMRAVKLIILHPFGIIGRKSILFNENAQFSFFFFLSKNWYLVIVLIVLIMIVILKKDPRNGS